MFTKAKAPLPPASLPPLNPPIPTPPLLRLPNPAHSPKIPLPLPAPVPPYTPFPPVPCPCPWPLRIKSIDFVDIENISQILLQGATGGDRKSVV